MKRTKWKMSAVALSSAALLMVAGCGRQTRGSSDANAQSRAATTSEGGSESTAGSAGDSKSFGDTQAKAAADGVSPSASQSGRSKDASANKPPPPAAPPVTQPTR
jgi:hypothetical protein